MKTILRNFFTTLRRFRMATLLNILGLSVAFSAFIIMMMQVDYEKSFDRCHSHASRIYRIEMNSEEYTGNIILSRPFIDAILRSSPQIETGTLLNPYTGAYYFTIQKGNNTMGFKEAFMACYPEIVRMFDFEMQEGDAGCLKDREKVLIPESMARKFFGEEPALGKRLDLKEPIWVKNKRDFLVVGGVYKDFPGNTQLTNAIYVSMDDDWTKTNWTSNNYFGFVMLQPGVSGEEAVESFNHTFDFKSVFKDNKNPHITLRPLTDIYYLNESQDGRLVKSGNAETTRVVLIIAFLIIIIAAINFTNFSTALTPLRIKSINTQKVLGSSDIVLRVSLLIEAMGIAFFSYLIALGQVYVLHNGDFLPFVKADLNLIHHMGLMITVGVLSLFVGFLAGLYPAYYITSFPPAIVLKGSFGLSLAGRKLRTVLLGIQFVISLILIIGASFVYLQNRYMQQFSLGFDKDQIVIVELDRSLVEKNKDTYVNKLKEYPGIEDVAFALEKLGAQDNYMTWSGVYNEQDVGIYALPVSWNFPDVMGIRSTGGRKPAESDEKGNLLSLLLFDSMRKQYAMNEGDLFNVPWLEDTPCRIIGFVEDVHFGSLRGKMGEVALIINYWSPLHVSYIRIKAGSNVDEVTNHIYKTVASIDPTYPVDIQFYDSVFDQLYRQEKNLSTMVFLFSLLAIIISLVGVFGLVVFEAQYRQKEIGIRKVYGSTVREILLMLNKLYIRIILICFVIASPVAYYGVKKWLENFSYKTPVYGWVFAGALFLVLVITLATVVFQSWRAANTNPVNSIKNE